MTNSELLALARTYSFDDYGRSSAQVELSKAGWIKPGNQWLQEYGLKLYQTVCNGQYILEKVNEAGWCSFRLLGYRAGMAPMGMWKHISQVPEAHEKGETVMTKRYILSFANANTPYVLKETFATKEELIDRKLELQQNGLEYNCPYSFSTERLSDRNERMPTV